MPKLLVIDDEPNIRFSIEQVFDRSDVRVLGAETAEEGLELAAEESPDVILLDIRLGNRSGLEVFRDLRRMDPKSLVVFVTGYGTTETAIEAMKLGAYDYLVKPLDANQIQKVVEQACEISRLMHVPAIVEEGDRPEEKPDRLIGSGQAMQMVCKQIGRVAPQDVNVLILGESGTGKELVARAIHYSSRRASAPFVPVSCAAIPEGLLESELFGHLKGSFTGASETRAGFLQTAEGGTIFLDEISSTTLATQVKLLRVLQEKEVCMVGSTRGRRVDIRILAATNKDLPGLVKKGAFREDLYFRLNVLTIDVPPLRDRGNDVLILIRHFAEKFSTEMGKPVPDFSPQALQVLRNYHWPGNVRELENVVQRLVVMNEVGAIEVPDLPSLMRFSGLRNVSYDRTLAEVETEYIRNVLESVNGNKTRAAEILGIDRKTLREKLKSRAAPAP
jgi:DNA-binding NtrC family response regulator